MYDTIIIGSGPAGLSAAVYAKRAELDFILIEKEYGGTGQIAESERVDNYLGLYGENGFDLGERFRSHAEALGTEFYEGEVSEISAENSGYKVTLADGTAFETKTIVYAAGASHRRLDIKGEAEFSGKGVSYCAVCDGAFCKGKTAAVIGGGDTALGDALYLSKAAEKVYLIHRRDTFRANRLLQKQVSEVSNIEIILNAVPLEITGEKRVEALRISRNGQEEALPVHSVFAAVGTIPNSGALKGIAELDANGYIIAGEDCVTSAKGIFAAGDVRTKALRQVITAAADGANSISSVQKYLTENRR
ncbi:MAG: FAD-dependent oxidoreductase [Oscillospiraceae bacterium]|nr:FAD-dependent oxidoreductase [Oscillospiraceae bacterium]